MAINIFYRYKVNKEQSSNEMQIAGINLSKNWKDFDRKQEALEPFIKTEFNTKGLIDFEVYRPLTNEVFKSTIAEVKLPEILSNNDLVLASRDELVQYAKGYGIDPVNKRDDFLKKLILQKQKERLQSKVQENETN